MCVCVLFVCVGVCVCVCDARKVGLFVLYQVSFDTDVRFFFLTLAWQAKQEKSQSQTEREGKGIRAQSPPGAGISCRSLLYIIGLFTIGIGLFYI